MRSQRIVDGRVRIPTAPPLPLLAEGGDGTFSASLSAGGSLRLGSRISAGAFDDSAGIPVGLDGGSGSIGGTGALRWHVFWLGGELSQERISAMGGMEISGSWSAFNLYAGSSMETISDQLVLVQRITDVSRAPYDTVVRVSESGWTGLRTWGGAFELGPRPVRAFVAVRHIEGPVLDGTRGTGSAVPAENALELSRNLVDFGMRFRFRNGVGLVAGGGVQRFSDRRLGGLEAHGFAGIEVRTPDGGSRPDAER